MTKLISKPTGRHSPDSILLFLDFDGVLRRLSSDPSQFDADCLENFESALRPLPFVEVVISSTWRLALSLTELRRFFSTDVADRIGGVTPELSEQSRHARYGEIQAYLKDHGVGNDCWVAIDDDPTHYPKNAPVLFTDPNTGFDAECATRLWDYVAKLYPL